MSQSSLKLRKASIEDYDSYYSIRAEKLNLFWTGYETAPNYEGFSSWYKKRLSEENRDLFLLFDGNDCIGSLNMDYYEGYVFIGYSIKENSVGKGLGTFLVQRAVELSKTAKPELKSIKAWINFQNIGSIRVVEKNGFYKNDITETRKRFGNEELYFQFELKL